MNRKAIIFASIMAIFFALGIVKDVFIKIAVEKGAEMVTGLPLKIHVLRVGLIRTNVTIRDLLVYNPKGYTDRIMLDMPEIYVDYDLPAVMKGDIYLPELRINMKEFVVVKNADGTVNIEALKSVKAGKTGAAPDKGETGRSPQIRIDKLELKIGKVVYKDYSQGDKPVVREFKVDLNERYSGITDPYKLVTLIVVKALMNTPVPDLAKIGIAKLEATVSDTLATAEQAAQQAVSMAGEAMQGMSETTGKVVQSTQETVEKTAEEVTKVLSLPFGGGQE